MRRQDPRHVHHGREPGDVGPRRRTTRAQALREARACSSCRTSSSPRPRISPTWCCRPPRGPRRPARSPTPTAWCSSAGRRSTTPGEARQDLVDHRRDRQAARPRLDTTRHPREVFDEMRQAMPSIAGITWERLERESRGDLSVQQRGRSRASRWCSPSASRRRPAARSSSRRRPHPGRRAPDAEYPFVLITGRQLEHWHTGSMTRRAEVLDAIEPEPVASMHRLDLAALGVEPGGVDHRGVAPRRASRSTRAPTRARRAARCSSRSATTRRRRTCSPIRCSIRSARSPSSSTAQ